MTIIAHITQAGAALLGLAACTWPNPDVSPGNEKDATVKVSTSAEGGNPVTKPDDKQSKPSVSKPPSPGVEPKLSPWSPPAEVDPPPPNVDVTDPG